MATDSLLTCKQPIMDGLKCTECIRAFEKSTGRAEALPIIAVRANARSEHGLAAIEAGMQAVTTKPYKIDDLVQQIEQVCRSVVPLAI